MTRHDAVGIAQPALFAARVAGRPVTADLAAAAVQARGLFGLRLVGWRRAARRPGLHEVEIPTATRLNRSQGGNVSVHMRLGLFLVLGLGFRVGYDFSIASTTSSSTFCFHI